MDLDNFNEQEVFSVDALVSNNALFVQSTDYQWSVTLPMKPFESFDYEPIESIMMKAGNHGGNSQGNVNTPLGSGFWPNLLFILLFIVYIAQRQIRTKKNP